MIRFGETEFRLKNSPSLKLSEKQAKELLKKEIAAIQKEANDFMQNVLALENQAKNLQEKIDHCNLLLDTVKNYPSQIEKQRFFKPEQPELTVIKQRFSRAERPVLLSI